MSECIFCRIVEGTLPSKRVYEDDECLAFHDVNPQARVHLLVIPKRHIPSLADVQLSDRPILGHLLTICHRVADEAGLTAQGYRVVINTGAAAGQTVFHLHFHVMGGRTFRWPPG
ncbi:MAG: histidine triad nucleotide-binding protein [Nitrospirae bacterium]|nr:MAG: histidine triad nucleotide-binding protein [Nitrospirota bacterium]